MTHHSASHDSRAIVDRIADSDIVSLISESFSASLKSWVKIAATAILGLLFIFSFGIVLGATQIKAMEHLIELMRMTGENTGGLINAYNDTAVATNFFVLQKDSTYQYHLQSVFVYIGIIIVAGLLLWILFEGISWWLVYSSSKEKGAGLGFLRFIRNFSIVSAFFHILTVLLIIFSVKLMFNQLTSITPILGKKAMDILFFIGVCVIWYFGALAYAMDDKKTYKNIKDAFVFGTTKILKILPSVIVFFVLMLNVDFILRLLAFNVTVMVIGGIILFFPVYFFCRVLLFKTVEKHWYGTARSEHHVHSAHKRHRVWS
jgi:hypothetical protein